MKLKLYVKYDGTDFCGWQKQPNGTSVQEVLETAIFSLTNEQVSVTGSGRTDAGVHANMQVASLTLKNFSMPENKFYKALNPLLPKGVIVYKSERAEEDFHAVKSAKKKTYSYSFYVSEYANPLLDRYSLRIDKLPNFKLIKKAIKILTGEHDFKSFCSSNSSAKTTVRTVYSIKIKKNKNGFCFLVTGNGFLYNMVRTLSGTLLEVGYEKLPLKNVALALKTGERKHVGKTLAPNGLCLQSVEY